jgi:SpoVK/Ycf46/Vps4 family AAA+-type ATPase
MNRAGRFDRAYEIALPDETLRRQYLELRGLGNFVGDEAMAETVRLTEGFSLAQLGEVYVSAALQWHEHGEPQVEDTIFNMRGELDKKRKSEWLKETAAGKVGFF